jgi:branched-chain amino acid transport system permease protein
VIGAFIIVFIQNIVSTYIERWPTLIGVIFILVILFARDGIVGGISKFWYRWLERRGGNGSGAGPADVNSSEALVEPSTTK